MTNSSRQPDRVLIFDTTLRDGEQCPGATMTFEDKIEVAEPSRRNGRRHHRGRLSHRLRRRFRSRLGDSSSGFTRHRSGPRPRHRRRYRPGRRRRTPCQAPAHPHLRLDLADPSRPSDAEVRGRGAGDHRPHRQPGARACGRRRVVGHGCHPDAARLSLPLRRGGHQGGCHDHQPTRHRRLRYAGRIHGDVPRRARARARCRQGRLLGPLPRRSRARGRQHAGRARRRCAPGRMHHQRHR